MPFWAFLIFLINFYIVYKSFLVVHNLTGMACGFLDSNVNILNYSFHLNAIEEQIFLP
mgnify:CR=1 FL=1